MLYMRDFGIGKLLYDAPNANVWERYVVLARLFDEL